MLTNFIFNLPFCRRACRSGIVSSEISSPLSWKHIGAEFASCRPPLPSAAIILRPHPALWPASLPGSGPRPKSKGVSFQSRPLSPSPPTPPHPTPSPTPLTSPIHVKPALPHYISYPGSGAPGSASHVAICPPTPPTHTPHPPLLLRIRFKTPHVRV